MAKLKSNNPVRIDISNFQYVKDNYHILQKICYHCDVCNDYVEKILKGMTSPDFLCRKHLIQKTAIERYGSMENMIKLNLQHGKETSMERYGVEHYSNIEKYRKTCQDKYGTDSYTNRDKAKQTLIDRYGVDNCSLVHGSRDKAKETWMNKYGVDNPMKSDEIKQKQFETISQKYGVGNISQLQFTKEKVVETNKERFGVECPMQSEKVKQRMQQTCLDKYGVDNPMKLQSVKDKVVETLIQNYGKDYESVLREKSIRTCMVKYGVDNPAKSESIKDKIKQTVLERYGVDSVLKSKGVWNKIRNTFLIKYGDKYPQLKHTYCYDNIMFDSSWELYFYVYYKEHGFDVIREPEIIPYEFNGEMHYYHPDFKIGNQLYEIKGDHFFNENGTMRNPFDPSKDKLFEAKHQCCIQNNVIFVKSQELKPIKGWVNAKFGKEYIESFKIC